MIQPQLHLMVLHTLTLNDVVQLYVFSLLPSMVFKDQPCSMPVAVQLQAGDTLQVMANTAADREFSYSVITNRGVHAIFAGTPSSGGDTDLTHILSGQSIGQSLTGQSIVSHWATSC